MLYKRIILIIALSVFISGCKFFNKQNEQSVKYNSGSLRELATKAISGDSTANKLLDGFADLSLPVMNNYNSLVIDSLRLDDGKKFYTVLASFSNPVYNRFAVYDTLLNLYLNDKSLNGYFDSKILDINGRKLIKVSENFLSKDVLSLNRISLYQVTDTSCGLIFRTFTKLIEPKNEFTQEITSFSDDRIVTTLKSKKVSPISNKGDTFVYNFAQEKYLSANKIFDNFVKSEVDNFKRSIEKPEIKDKESYLSSVGIDTALDTIKTTGNVKDSDGYTLTLPDNNWKIIRGIAITDLLNKPMKGARFINEIIGANISIVSIPPQDSAEMFEKYPLGNMTAGKYIVRFSDKYPSRKDFVQFFEVTCGEKKYILILRASKYTYDEFKTMYNGIINSFTIDC